MMCVCVGGGVDTCMYSTCGVHVLFCVFVPVTRMSFCMYLNMISCLCFGGWKEGETDN